MNKYSVFNNKKFAKISLMLSHDYASPALLALAALDE
jgi:hypothetical protein